MDIFPVIFCTIPWVCIRSISFTDEITTTTLWNGWGALILCFNYCIVLITNPCPAISPPSFLFCDNNPSVAIKIPKQPTHSRLVFYRRPLINSSLILIFYLNANFSSVYTLFHTVMGQMVYLVTCSINLATFLDKALVSHNRGWAVFVSWYVLREVSRFCESCVRNCMCKLAIRCLTSLNPYVCVFSEPSRHYFGLRPQLRTLKIYPHFDLTVEPRYKNTIGSLKL